MLDGKLYAQQIFNEWQTQIVSITDLLDYGFNYKDSRVIIDFKVEAQVILIILEDKATQ